MTELTRRELVRAAELLKETDPRSSEYHCLLRSIEYLDSMGAALDEIAALIDWEIATETAGEGSAIKDRLEQGELVQFPGKKEWMETMRTCGYAGVRHKAFTLGICRMYVGVKP